MVTNCLHWNTAAVSCFPTAGWGDHAASPCCEFSAVLATRLRYGCLQTRALCPAPGGVPALASLRVLDLSWSGRMLQTLHVEHLQW